MKYSFLDSGISVSKLQWEALYPDAKGNWLTGSEESSFESLIPLVMKGGKHHDSPVDVIFGLYSLGVVTNRDSYAYNYNADELQRHITLSIEAYAEAVNHLARLRSSLQPVEVIDVNDRRIKWTRQVKNALAKMRPTEFLPEAIRIAVYRPFCKQLLYFDNFWNEEQYQFRHIYPRSDSPNTCICVPSIGGRSAYWIFATATADPSTPPRASRTGPDAVE